MCSATEFLSPKIVIFGTSSHEPVRTVFTEADLKVRADTGGSITKLGFKGTFVQQA